MLSKKTDTIETISLWLKDLPSAQRTTSQDDCFSAIVKAIRTLGYGYPFDREQTALNELLVDTLAGEEACKTAWNFYHETQIIKAVKSKGRRPSPKVIAS